ncbi:MAG: glycosyl hydrolase family 28-related protein, partial [Blastocatellia bacterium]
MHLKWKTALLAASLSLIFPAAWAFAQAASPDGAVVDSDPRLNVYHNVKKMGAAGDGVTDDSAALQAAINAGHAVMIPEGTYNFSTTLTLKKDSVIVGAGKRSVLRYTGAGVALREPEGSYVNGYDNIKLINFTLTTNSNSQAGVELTNNYQVTM